MQEVIAQFHWLRPWWLLALVPAALLVLALWRQVGRPSQWRQLIAPDLLRFLLDKRLPHSSRWPLLALLGAWVVAAIALAGPSWEKLPQPVSQLEAGVVVLWDLSPSMLAEDIKPSRLVRSRYKLTDYLRARNEGLTGLVAYAGEAYIISPLTDDTNTIINLLPALTPAIMPLQGSNVEMAADMGVQLLKDSGFVEGELLLVTDGIAPAAQATLVQRLGATPYRLSILGVGTDEGAPIPTGSAGFAKDDANNIVIAQLGSPALQQLARRLGGVYVDLQAGNTDVNFLLRGTHAAMEATARQRQLERDFDTWRDGGQYVALLLIPFVALAFRRGWIVSLCVAGLLYPKPSSAFEWQDLWLRGDQQGQHALEAGDAQAAARAFTRPDWQGAAHYRNENYPAAAEKFSQLDGADAHYNRGNALAKAGKLEAALQAYDSALEQAPQLEDAQHNRELVQRLLEQQQQQQQGGQNQQDEQNNEQAGNQSQPAPNGNQQPQSAQQNEADQQNPGEQQGAQQPSDQAEDEESAQRLAQRDETKPTATAAESSQPHSIGEPPQGEELDAAAEEETAKTYAAAEQLPNSEEQQALEQWLRQIPDDPSGLLRRKLEFQHRQLRHRYRTGQWEPPDNEAYKRW